MWDVDRIHEVLFRSLETCSLRNGCGLSLKYWIWPDKESGRWKIMIMAVDVSKHIPIGSFWVNEQGEGLQSFPECMAGLRVELEPAHPWQIHAWERIKALVQQEQVGWLELDYVVSFSSLRLLAPDLDGYRVEGPQTWKIKVNEGNIDIIFWEQAAVSFGTIDSELCSVGRFGNEGIRSDMVHRLELFCLTDGTDVVPITSPITWNELYELIGQLVGDGTLAYQEDLSNPGWLLSPEILWKVNTLT